MKSKKHGCSIFFRKDLSVLELPSYFVNAVSKHSVIWDITERARQDGFTEHVFTENNVSQTTISSIENSLRQYLNWVNIEAEKAVPDAIDKHHNFPQSIINSYLNDYLIEEKHMGEHSVAQHLIALRAYYTYLAMTGFTTAVSIYIKPDLKKTARENTNSRGAVQYISPKLRSVLYRNTNCIRDELLLKTGAELGLRTKENLGLLVNDFKHGNKVYSGFKSLFAELDIYPDKIEFEYFLAGKFVKEPRGSGGGIGRMLYIHRSLLLRFQKYYKTERPQPKESAKNSLFLTNSKGLRGAKIPLNAGTTAFRQVRLRVMGSQKKGFLKGTMQSLEQDHTYHVLRHTFGTDLFYNLSKRNRMPFDDITTTSQVYLTVAERMGHNAADERAPATTRKYIRSCHIKEAFENE